MTPVYILVEHQRPSPLLRNLLCLPSLLPIGLPPPVFLGGGGGGGGGPGVGVVGRAPALGLRGLGGAVGPEQEMRRVFLTAILLQSLD